MLLLLTPLFCLWFRRPLFQGNFGVVEPGRVYRILGWQIGPTDTTCRPF